MGKLVVICCAVFIAIGLIYGISSTNMVTYMVDFLKSLIDFVVAYFNELLQAFKESVTTATTAC